MQRARQLVVSFVLYQSRHHPLPFLRHRSSHKSQGGLVSGRCIAWAVLRLCVGLLASRVGLVWWAGRVVHRRVAGGDVARPMQ